MSLPSWILLATLGGVVAGACSSSGSDTPCSGDPPSGQECCCGTCYPSQSCACVDGEWACNFSDACYMKTCPGEGGGGAGGFGGSMASGGAGGAAGGDACKPCAAMFATCDQPVMPDECLGAATLCAAHVPQYDDLVACLCSTACELECDAYCGVAGVDAACQACIDAATATGGACEAAFTACPSTL